MARALISWSGGKDSAWALRLARESGIEPIGLLTSYNETSDQVPIHDVPMQWIRRHSELLGLPLRTVPLPWPCDNQEYLHRFSQAWIAAVDEGIDTIVFGDIHLADIRAFREQALASTGLTPIFPLWGCDSAQLARNMIAGGINATVTSVDTHYLSSDNVGSRFDASFIDSLPLGVDPCGENGEFHTAVWL